MTYTDTINNPDFSYPYIHANDYTMLQGDFRLEVIRSENSDENDKYLWTIYVDNVSSSGIKITRLHTNLFPVRSLAVQNNPEALLNPDDWIIHADEHQGRFNYKDSGGFEFPVGYQMFMQFKHSSSDIIWENDTNNEWGWLSWYYVTVGYAQNHFHHIERNHVNNGDINTIIHEPTGNIGNGGNGGKSICIMEGQKVLLDGKGYTNIEDVGVNDKINGNDIIGVTMQVTNEKLIKFPHNCFGNNIPNEDLYMTPEHLVYDPVEEKLENAGIMYNKYNFVEFCDPPCHNIYNVIVQGWKVMSVNNMKCETLCPLHSKAIAEYNKHGLVCMESDMFLECVSSYDLVLSGDSIIPKNIQLKKIKSNKPIVHSHSVKC